VSGQWIEDEGIPLITDKQNMQGLGSAITYAKRYGLQAMGFIVTDEDDDGNSASKPIPSQATPPVKASAPYKLQAPVEPYSPPKPAQSPAKPLQQTLATQAAKYPNLSKAAVKSMPIEPPMPEQPAWVTESDLPF